MADGKAYVTPGFVAAMVVVGASGVVIVVVAAILLSWGIWKYYVHLRRPTPGLAVHLRGRMREAEGILAMEAGLQRASGGVSKGLMQALPMLQGGLHTMSECPVCLEVYKEGERVRLLPNCKHVFHSVCISTWLESHTTCPLCRTDLQVSKNPKQGPSLLERIVHLIRRGGGGGGGRGGGGGGGGAGGGGGGGGQVVDSSSDRDRFAGRVSQPVVQQQQQAPPPSATTGVIAVEPPGMIFSSVWGSYVDVHAGASTTVSSPSSSGFSNVSVTFAGSEDACSSATEFVAISLDSDHPER